MAGGFRCEKAAISERVAIIRLVHEQTNDINNRLLTLETFENKEHGAYKFIGIGFPLVVGAAGLTVSIIKLASGG